MIQILVELDFGLGEALDTLINAEVSLEPFEKEEGTPRSKIAKKIKLISENLYGEINSIKELTDKFDTAKDENEILELIEEWMAEDVFYKNIPKEELIKEFEMELSGTVNQGARMVVDQYSKRLLEITTEIEKVRNQFVKELQVENELEARAKRQVIYEINISISSLLIVMNTLFECEREQTLREMFADTEEVKTVIN